MPIPSRHLVLQMTASIAALLIVACSSTSPVVREKLDPQTGVTITFNRTPLVMYRENPSRAAYARNYLHLGPISVNRGGSHRYYLWIGIWNTMQAVSMPQHRDGFESIVILVDGEPLFLEVSGWTPDVIGASESAYIKPVASAADAYYQVTADQIRLLAEAQDIRLRTAGSPAKEYQLWDDQISARNDLTAFLNQSLY